MFRQLFRGAQVVSARRDVVLCLSAPDYPPDVVSVAQQRLVNAFNERAPIADFVRENRQEGTKGPVEIIGQIGLALISADVVKYIAEVIVEFMKRNTGYIVTIDDITIMKGHASARDIDRISKQLHKIMVDKKKR